jgi:STE24 endopeptidase
LRLGALSLGAQGALLAALVRRPPAAMSRGGLPAAAGAGAAGAALSVALTAASLPVRAAMRRRARAVGLVTQSWRGWARDVALSSAIGAGLSGAATGAGIALMRRFPRGWWVPGAALTAGFGVVALYAGPALLDPLFNRFTPLPDGETRRDVLELARRAGVDVGEVYEVDASRRTTAANAYVTGLGATKRVVLFDTLLASFTRDEVRLVVAHELAHVRHRDVVRGLAFIALVAPAALVAVDAVVRRMDGAAGDAGPQTVPALTAAVALVAVPVSLAGNRLSRRIEARADSFSLRLTGAVEPFVSFERRIVVRNVADPDPPRWRTALLATHPPTLERIGIAKAYEAGAR